MAAIARSSAGSTGCHHGARLLHALSSTATARGWAVDPSTTPTSAATAMSSATTASSSARHREGGSSRRCSRVGCQQRPLSSGRHSQCSGLHTSARISASAAAIPSSSHGRSTDDQEASSSTSASSSAAARFPFPTHTRNPSPYEIFHLDRSASQAQIKSRYYDLVRIFHPDRLAADEDNASSSSSSAAAAAAAAAEKGKQVAEERFKLIVKAYELLSDRAQRGTYDRYGFGWGDSSRAGPPWGERNARKGWEHRGDAAGAGGHDRYGWQRYYGSGTYSAEGSASHEYFYGFAAREHQNSSRQPRYLPNGTFISLLLLLTWTVVAFQYTRLSAQAQRATQRADKVHLDAAHSLRVAREGAKGEEGRRRREAVRRRVRELSVLEHVRALEEGRAVPGSDAEPSPLGSGESKWGIGHGGPSGREAYLERIRRLEAPKDASSAGQRAGNPEP